MPEVVAGRSSILQAKRHEISSISTSRKRKLRELYAVYSTYSTEHPLPFVALDKLDDLSATPLEEQFLVEYDISQKSKSIEEAILPLRRQLRPDTARFPSEGLTSLDGRPSENARIPSKGSRENVSKTSRGRTPGKEKATVSSIGLLTAPEVSRDGRPTSRLDATSTKPRRGSSRASSRGSQTELPSSSTPLLDKIVDEPIAEAVWDQQSTQNDPITPELLEEERIKTRVQSQPGSPGVDPRKAIPLSAEDVANLSEPIINGAQDPNHKAATVHLPSKEAQERRLQEVAEHRAEKAQGKKKTEEGGNLSIRLPPPHGSRTFPDPMSSPGSTLDAQSATTPALHEASSDTSPDNEGPRYHPDRSDDKDEIPETPSTSSENGHAAENADPDGGVNPEMDIFRADTLGGSPTAVDAQLRLEEEQAAAASRTDTGLMNVDHPRDATEKDVILGNDDDLLKAQPLLPAEAAEIVRDIVEDEEQVVGASKVEERESQDADTAAQLCSKADGTSSLMAADGDAMEVDTAVNTQLHIESPPVDEVSASRNADLEASGPLESALGAKKDSNAAKSSSTPRRTPPVPVTTPPTQERMKTRVLTGAMKHKSVSEILGEIPRPNTSASERPAVAKVSVDPESAPDSISQSRSTTPQSPGCRMRTMMERAKEKERSKLSTVVFAKPSNHQSSSTALVPSSQRSQTLEQPVEYLMPLIVAQAAHQLRHPQNLDALLQQAHKTVTTSNLYVPVHEQQTMKVLRRIFRLQQEDRWSLRQPKRCPEPNRPTTHWDELLKEAKWMRTDFREERKWKITVARNLAYDCAEWLEADPEERKELQVNAMIPLDWRVQSDTEMENAYAYSSMAASHPTPDLIPSAENESLTDEFDDEPRTSTLHAVAPATLFTLNDDDVVFGLRRSPVTDGLLEELPMYGIPLKIPQGGVPVSDIDPDASWRRSALPLSKYMEGKLVLSDEGPPRKKSRYCYDEEDEDEDHVVFGADGPKRTALPPTFSDVALFNPENKHIRDRIHAGHQFRPPSENPMPLQSFFECRLASQWTWPEDDELKALVREYSYNWQLISCLLTSPSMYISGPERRTPWECFERWIHLEGLPADMQKTHYFRAYNNRLEAAQRNLMAMAQQVSQQPNATGAMIPSRRRSTTSVRVERRRNQKHLTLVDAMRKLAKKRETNMQKQHQAAQMAESRKKQDPPQQPQQNVKHTPQDFSRMKQERQNLLDDRMARMQMQQEAQRRAQIMAARNPQANSQQFTAAANGNSQQPRNPGVPNAGPALNVPPNGNRPNQLAVPGQNMVRPPMPQAMPNGIGGQVPMPNPGTLPQIPMNGVPQGQMNGIPGVPNMQGIPGRLPVPNQGPNLQLMIQSRQIADQQRHTVQMQQQHSGQSQVHNSPPNMRANMNGNMNGMNQQAYMQNNGLLAANFNAGNLNGISTPSPNGFGAQNPVSSSSPRMGHPNQPQQMPNGSMAPQIAKLEAQFRAQYPQDPAEQINQMVRDAIRQNMANQNMVQQRANAMHAAAGMPGVIQNGPQQYAQMLRAQQEKQAASQQNRSASAGSASGNNAMSK